MIKKIKFNYSEFCANLRVLKQLLLRDVKVFKPNYKDRVINGIIWSSITAITYSYILPVLGVKADYGAFVLVANAATWGLFDIMTNVANLISDIEGEKSISYYLTLPIPQSWIFLKIAIANAYQAIVISIILLPLGKLILWNSFSLANFSILKFLIIFPLLHIFYGLFSLWVASRLKNLQKLHNVWLRIIFPLWFLGGYQFSWANLNQISPIFAKFALLNPITYIMEGIRNAVMGPDDYLNFGLCVLALIIFSSIMARVGIKSLMKRLDCL